MYFLTRLAWLLFVCWSWGSPAQSLAAVRDFLPENQETVVQVLAPRVRPLPEASSTMQVLSQARDLVEQSRRFADPRFLGRAQALLTPWWNKPDAPTEIAILQATIEQSRHLFADARKTLLRVLKAHPRDSQALLTLSTIERVSGNYLLAKLYCEQLAQSGASLYAQACLHETASLTGKQLEARDGLQRLSSQHSTTSTKAWLLSLAAENAERSGNDRLADSLYKDSLRLDADLYTSLAFADMQLRTGQTRQALSTLQTQPNSDAVLLRRARAQSLLGNTAASSLLVVELRERFEAMRQRADDSRLHGRELALFALWLDNNPVKAFAIAQSSLTIQKEPLDWWVYLSSARASGDATSLLLARRQFESSGLVDLRISRLLELK
jgi:hypothetical protein